MDICFHRLAWFIKGAIDKLVAGFLLILLSPIIVLLALIVKLDSPGSAIYKHIRIGKNGKPFYLYKLRSMRTGSDDKEYMAYLKQLIDYNLQGDSTHPYRKMEGDGRITRVGAFMRKYYLDELPQFWNILKGDMSLIGPRPHVQFEVNYYTPQQLRRLSVRPGVTGLWQAGGKADCSFQELIALDLEYIDHWSPGLDTSILFRTIGLLVRGGEGSRFRLTRRTPDAKMNKISVQ